MEKTKHFLELELEDSIDWLKSPEVNGAQRECYEVRKKLISECLAEVNLISSNTTTYEYSSQQVRNKNAHAILSNMASEGWRVVGFDNDGYCWFERVKSSRPVGELLPDCSLRGKMHIIDLSKKCIECGHDYSEKLP